MGVIKHTSYKRFLAQKKNPELRYDRNPQDLPGDECLHQSSRRRRCSLRKVGTGARFAPRMFRLAQTGLPIGNVGASTGEPLKGGFFQSHNSSAKKPDSCVPNPVLVRWQRGASS